MGHDVTRYNVEEPPLRELNAALRILVDIFPNVQPEVFREMLSSISAESRLQIVTENLLKNEAQWVRGRLRVMHEAEETEEAKVTNSKFPQPQHQVRLAAEDRFRSLSYKTAVSEALSLEFKGLNRSTIKAILAECNYSYTMARPKLLEQISKSWRFTVSRFIFRRKTPTATEHPLVVWEPCRVGSSSLMQPTLRFTSSTELNLELWNEIIQPVLDKQKLDRVRDDWQYAKVVNERQAEEHGELYDCQCCFVSYAMDHMTACTDHSHFVCYSCIRRTVDEALFGQGWAKSIDHERCTVRCVAPGSGGLPCAGFIPAAMVQMAIEEDIDRPDMWEKLQNRCASEVLLKSRLPLIRCPFCVYAELDDFSTQNVRWKFPVLPTFLLAFAILQFLLLLRFTLFRRLILVNLISFFFRYLRSKTIPGASYFESARLRLSRKRRGLKFTCASPRCSRSSCLNCRKPWTDIHICFESSRLALRAAIEAATTDAVKRTCPVCNLSFVKEAGCNKLTCVCGYTMCYVCRQEIGREKYSHFCQHFRQRPGEPCTECEKCDLYKVEDEEGLVREAARRAEVEWWERERRADVVDLGEGRVVVGDEGERRALQVERLDMESKGRLDAWIRGIGNKAKWETFGDRILGEFIA